MNTFFRNNFFQLSHKSKNMRHMERFADISGWHPISLLLQMPDNRDEKIRLITCLIHFFLINLQA